MDKITQSLLEDFCKKQDLKTSEDFTENFEKFCNFTVVSNEYEDDEFDVEDFSTDKYTGVDGVAVLVNGSLINNPEEVDDLVTANKTLDVTFLFIQAKTSDSFDSGAISKFCEGVKDIFTDPPALNRTEPVRDFVKVREKIFSLSPKFKSNPTCKLFYVTTGTWTNDRTLKVFISSGRKSLENLNLFSSVTFEPIDRTNIQKLYRAISNRTEAQVLLPSKITLPEMANVKQSFLGILTAKEYLKLIAKEDKLMKHIFYDNVRDYKGDNPVNSGIAETISSDQKILFCLLNNGITVIAQDLSFVGDKCNITNYQIVNGCQTSHVIFNCRNKNLDGINIPIRLIETENDAVRDSVIKATNSQTDIKPEEFESLKTFHKNLETFFATYKDDSKRLYYERRSRQYNNDSAIRRLVIVDIRTLIRCFASMFLDEPHTAGRYPGTLLKESGQRMFVDSHKYEPYYTSAYTYYRVEQSFRKQQIDKKYRKFKHYLIMIIRYQICGNAPMPDLSSKKIPAYCARILSVIWDDAKVVKAIKNATTILDNVIAGKTITRDDIRLPKFKKEILDALQPVPAKRAKLILKKKSQ